MHDRIRAAQSLIDLFRLTVRDHPQRVAVSTGGDHVTYAQLDEMSDAACRRILAAGPHSGDLVGVFVGRDLASIVSILGVMKAGSAYVPLDPSYPARRLSHLISDSKIGMIVRSPGAAPDVDVDGLVIVDPRVASPVPEGLAASALPRASAASDPAYVIYTSGSTGQPKGCVVTHGNVLALLDAALPLFDFTPDDRWALFHSLSFDFSVWELWGAFATGATVVCVPAATAQSAEDFIAFLDSEGVSVLNQVPSIFRYTLSVYRERPVPLPVRHLVFGGESVDLKDVAEFLALVPGGAPTVTNMYGITETTVHATFKRITSSDLVGAVRSPIGVPLPHFSIEIRDEHGGLVPDGQAGEMWVSGAGVADGYLNRPRLTAERFVEEAEDTACAARRFYRSGDLARRLPDGELEYLGRADHQVKLMGFRIELGEIEATLEQHPGVRDAVVLLTASRAGTPVLAACVVPTQAQVSGLTRELRSWAAGRVPRHMVPHLFHTVDTFPLTASGKTDRAAIKEAIENASAAPRNQS